MLAETEKAGKWAPVDKEDLMLKELEWPSKSIALRDIEQCMLLGWPID